MSPIVLSDPPAAGVLPEVFRIVTLSAGGRPVEVLDLMDGTFYQRKRGTFTYTPGVPTVQQSKLARRYGGGKTVGVTHDNGAISWTALIKAPSQDVAATRVETLLAAIENAARGRLVEWRPDGLTAHLSSFFRLAGPGTIAPDYQYLQWATGNFLECTITYPVAPLVEWAPMTIGDDFSVDSIADYTFDAGTGTLSVTGGQLVPSSTATKRVVHTARGYSYADCQATVKITTGATGTGAVGVMLKRFGVDDALLLWIRDAANQVRISKRDAGVEFLLTSAAGTVSASTSYWVRGRIEGNVLTVELFTIAPTPMATPATTVTHTLAGADATKFGAGVRGDAGIYWIPESTDERIDELTIEPYVRRNLTLPDKLTLRAIPGNAPAKLDLAVTPSGGSGAPVWALVGWTQTPTAPLAGAAAPFGILEAETAGDLTGWVSAADAGSRGGNRLIDATVSGAETYAASWTIDPATLVADDFTDGELSLELWCIAIVSSTLVSPTLTASIRPVDGLNFGSERFTDDYGSVGKLLTIGAGSRRPYRLGTLTVPVDALRPVAMKLWLAGGTAAGSTGVFGLDYLWLVPARARALTPSGKPFDSAFPKFVASTAETQKLIRSDLSGAVSKPPANPHPDHGLGGSLLEIPPGDVDLLIKLSSQVPDDPSPATTEQLAHSATVQARVTPRSFMLRSD